MDDGELKKCPFVVCRSAVRYLFPKVANLSMFDVKATLNKKGKVWLAMDYNENLWAYIWKPKLDAMTTQYVLTNKQLDLQQKIGELLFMYISNATNREYNELFGMKPLDIVPIHLKLVKW